MICCSNRAHPWDTFAVSKTWCPSDLRCLIVGESPSEPYIYDAHRRAAIQTMLLKDLHSHELIAKPNLSAFRDAGFLFDHAIRCLLPQPVIKQEWRRAKKFSSNRAETAIHLQPLLSAATKVWVMGYIARNAVAALCREFPRDRSAITKAPYPCQVGEAPRFFVSRYLLHASMGERIVIARRLHYFLDEEGSKTCSQCIAA